MLTPIPLLISWLIGLCSLAMLAAGILLLANAWRRWRRYDRPRPIAPLDSRTLSTREHLTKDQSPYTALPSANALRNPAILTPLLSGIALLLLVFAGRHLVQMAFPVGSDEPQAMRSGIAQEVIGPGGAKIHVELYGPADAPALLLTHGWGTNSTEWYYAKRHLSSRFRLIVWDLPGLGESPQPQDRDFALERMAAELHAVLSVTHGKPVVLVGHSIGGMINLTFCRLYPELVGTQIAGIVQEDTSYTNPVRTTKDSGFSLAIQKPIAEPILHAMIFLSPFVRVLNWLSYENGFSYLQNAQSSFAGAESRGQVDLVSRYQVEASPAVVARGTLAMFHWDATAVLPHITAPVLLLVGQEDTTTLPGASTYMQSQIPHSELRVVSPAAHYGLLELNQAYDTAVADFAFAHLKK